MKRAFGLLATLLLLAGCGGAIAGPDYREAVQQAAAQPYSFSGTLTVADLEQPMELSCQKSCDGLTLTLTAPPELAGLNLRFEEEMIRVEYRELVMNLVPGDIPESSVLVGISRALPALSEGTATQQEGCVLLTDTSSGTAGKALWQGENATLLWLELPTYDAKILVSTFEKAE